MSLRADQIPVQLLEQYRRQLQMELESILKYWLLHVQDDKGSFYGRVDQHDVPDPSAAKGIVLFSRICWAFSAAYSLQKTTGYLEAAKDAWQYISRHFVDHECGGVFWSVDADGKMLDGKKQIYGQAFCIYALAEFYKAAGNPEALRLARELFVQIERFSFDSIHNGYIEALSRDWTEAEDLRLSDKDENERKSANTHLHIIEAYANLYTVWPAEVLKERIQNLLDIFNEHIINHGDGHLTLFFDDRWNKRSELVSFGHDIEAAWLLTQCAERIRDKAAMKLYAGISIPVVSAALTGLDEHDGGIWYEYDPAARHWIREKHWWPQAEAMIGFFYAWEITGDKAYLQHSVNAWEFVRAYLIDHQSGEWFWGVYQDRRVIPKEKAGFWKCPYHNGRACIEIITRISHLLTR